MSFKQFGNFKERYFIVMPLMYAAIDSLYTRVKEVEDVRLVTRLMARFLLEWQCKHFK